MNFSCLVPSTKTEENPYHTKQHFSLPYFLGDEAKIILWELVSSLEDQILVIATSPVDTVWQPTSVIKGFLSIFL